MLGPAPSFQSGTSKVKTYDGEDCGGSGVPGLLVPIVGAIGEDAIDDAEDGIETNPTFQSDTYTDEETFEDLTSNSEPLVNGSYGPIEDSWTDCEAWHLTVETLREMADVVCPDGTKIGTTCAVPADSPQRRIFGDGDLTVGAGSHLGLIVVTGQLTLAGNTSWTGLIIVVGEGNYLINGAGPGLISGGVIIADIAGPDNIYGNDDDCTGGGDPPHEGFGSATYLENGGGNAGTVYCTQAIGGAWPPPPYEIREFLQR